MAIGDNYATLAQLKSYMGNDIGAAEDDELNDALASASREIEEYCHRQFNDAGSASARSYRPTDRRTVFVDDFHTTTGFMLEVDTDDDGTYDQLWLTNEYELRPRGGIREGRPGWPFIEIGAVDWLTFPDGYRAAIKVTARWGWASVPSMVKQACLELASSTYALRHARLGVAGSDQFGSVIRVQDNKLAMNKLKPFRRRQDIPMS